MIRRTRRSVTACVVALLGLGTAALTAVSGTQRLLGRPELIALDTVTGVGASVSISPPFVIASAALAAVLGLVLLAAALLPGRTSVLALDGAGTGIATGVHRRSLDRALGQIAATDPEVQRAQVRTTRRTITAQIHTADADRSQVRARVTESLRTRLEALAPGARQRVRVTTRQEGRR